MVDVRDGAPGPDGQGRRPALLDGRGPARRARAPPAVLATVLAVLLLLPLAPGAAGTLRAGTPDGPLGPLTPVLSNVSASPSMALPSPQHLGPRGEKGPVPTPSTSAPGSVSCTVNEGLPTTVTGPYNSSLPPSPFTPSPCTLSENVSVTAPSGQLLVTGPNGITVSANNANQSLWMDVAGSLVIGPGSFFNVAIGTSLRLSVQGSVLVAPGGNLTLSAGSTLVLGAGSSLTVDGGMFYTRGALVQAGGGNLLVEAGGLLEGSPMGPTPSPGVARVAHLNVAGSLSGLNDSGSALRWVNVSGGVGMFDLLGTSSSAPLLVQNLTVGQPVRSFLGDDLELADVSLASVGTLALGNLSASSDTVEVNGLTVAGSIPSVHLVHAQVSALSISSASSIAVDNSSFGPAASSITSVTTSFSANQSSHFGFPMVFNNAPWVNITNSTAPAIAVLGAANVSLYNWWVRTIYSGGTSAFLPNITTSSAQVAVHVYRYVLVTVVPAPPVVPASSVVISLCSTSPNMPCTHLGVDAQGQAGRFLLTDVVTLAGLDAFVGVYAVSADAAGGYSAGPVQVQVTSDNLPISLTMSTPAVAPELIPVFLLEVAGIGVVVGAIVLLRTQARRMERLRRPAAKPLGSGAKSERPPPASAEETEGREERDAPAASTPDRRPPAKEWKAPPRPR